jgi:hypothetical protein
MRSSYICEEMEDTEKDLNKEMGDTKKDLSKYIVDTKRDLHKEVVDTKEDLHEEIDLTIQETRRDRNNADPSRHHMARVQNAASRSRSFLSSTGRHHGPCSTAVRGRGGA